MHVFINYKQDVDPDHAFAKLIESRLRQDGHKVFRDESGVVPSQEWTKRLYSEIRACDSLVSLVSNASLQSTWCLTEVDYALKESKRVLPVVLEDIDDALDFQAFRPRFMLTQWYRITGDDTTDLNAISKVLYEPANRSFSHLIVDACRKHGIARPEELLTSFLNILHMTHQGAALDNQPYYFDGMAGIVGEGARSVAESVFRLAQVQTSINKHNSQNARKHGNEPESKSLSWQAQRDECLAEILKAALSVWDEQGKIYRKRIDEHIASQADSSKEDGT